MTHTPEQIKFMLDDMKKNNYHVYKLLTELLEETGRLQGVPVPPTPPPTRVITENGKVTYRDVL